MSDCTWLTTQGTANPLKRRKAASLTNAIEKVSRSSFGFHLTPTKLSSTERMTQVSLYRFMKKGDKKGSGSRSCIKRTRREEFVFDNASQQKDKENIPSQTEGCEKYIAEDICYEKDSCGANILSRKNSDLALCSGITYEETFSLDNYCSSIRPKNETSAVCRTCQQEVKNDTIQSPTSILSGDDINYGCDDRHMSKFLINLPDSVLPPSPLRSIKTMDTELSNLTRGKDEPDVPPFGRTLACVSENSDKRFINKFEVADFVGSESFTQSEIIQPHGYVQKDGVTLTRKDSACDIDNSQLLNLSDLMHQSDSNCREQENSNQSPLWPCVSPVHLTQFSEDDIE